MAKKGAPYRRSRSPRRVNRRLRHSPANPRHRIADDALAPCGARQRRPGAPTNGFLARLCKGRKEIAGRADQKPGSRIVHVPSANGRNRMKNQDGFGFLSAPVRRAAQGWLRWGQGLANVWAESDFSAPPDRNAGGDGRNMRGSISPSFEFRRAACRMTPMGPWRRKDARIGRRRKTAPESGMRNGAPAAEY